MKLKEKVMTEEKESPFYLKAQSTKNTTPLRKETSELLMHLFFAESKNPGKGPSMEECRKDQMCDLILKRVEAFNLPLKFTPAGLLALTFLTEGRPGKGVIGIIDLLTKYEGKETIEMQDIYDLYPLGMYNTKVSEDYIDNYLKPKKVKWAAIY